MATSNSAQIGIALHQMKRGKEFRRLIRVPQDFDVWTQPDTILYAPDVPEAYDILEFDFAGQEFRWMAVASKDQTMLNLCAPGEDAHSYMGAQIAGIDYHELIQRVKAGDPEADFQRKLGKFCIAEGTPILTNQGLVPVEKVSLDMRVWDGVEFVSHTGSVYQGEREVITYAGLTATPDHVVYLQDGNTCFFGFAAAQRSSLAQTGDGRGTVRFPAYIVRRCTSVGPRTQGELLMHQMQQAILDKQRQPESREDNAVSWVRIEGAASAQRSRIDKHASYEESAETVQCDASTVRKPQRSILQKLRGAWDKIQLWVGIRGDSVCAGVPTTSDVLEAGCRSREQQRPLRTREFEAGHKVCEPKEQKIKVRVYDITNAGPRNRYTAANYLILNSNLSFQYRVGPKTALMKARTDYEMDLDETFIKQILATYKSAFRGVAGGPGTIGYWQSAIYKAKMQGYAETFAGRRVQLKGSWAGRDAWPMESTAINYPIQGSGADQKYLALAVLRNLLPKFNGYFYMELHDGLFVIIPRDRSRQAGEVILKDLSNLPYKAAWGIDLPIAFPVDGKISSESWGDLKGL